VQNIQSISGIYHFLIQKEISPVKFKKGETISNIAETYKVSISSIQQWNNISGNKIIAGKELKIKKLDENAVIPMYKTSGSAGMDLSSSEANVIMPMEIKAVSTGLSIELPDGYEAQIRPRSGLSLKGITVVNSPGTIDSDYRGEIKVALINLGKKPFTIHRGDRIAQMIINRVYRVQWDLKDSLEVTERNEGGFGHTGR